MGVHYQAASRGAEPALKCLRGEILDETALYSVAFVTLMLSLGTAAWADVFQDAAKGNLPAVAAYLDKGGNVNAADQDGATSLHHAVAGNRASVVDLLVERPAKMSSAKKDGVPPFRGRSPASLDLIAFG